MSAARVVQARGLDLDLPHSNSHRLPRDSQILHNNRSLSGHDASRSSQQEHDQCDDENRSEYAAADVHIDLLNNVRCEYTMPGITRRRATVHTMGRRSM
jgi:hypothetical protein